MTLTRPSEAHERTGERLRQKQGLGASYYNRSVRSKEELVPGQVVRLFYLKQKIWEPATIVALADTPRSCIVQRLGGGTPLRRNRIHIRTTSVKWGSTAPLPELPKERPSPRVKEVPPPSGASSTMRQEEIAEPALGKRLSRQTVFYQAS